VVLPPILPSTARESALWASVGQHGLCAQERHLGLVPFCVLCAGPRNESLFWIAYRLGARRTARCALCCRACDTSTRDRDADEMAFIDLHVLQLFMAVLILLL
jgi:hypothetical protein